MHKVISYGTAPNSSKNNVKETANIFTVVMLHVQCWSEPFSIENNNWIPVSRFDAVRPFNGLWLLLLDTDDFF